LELIAPIPILFLAVAGDVIEENVTGDAIEENVSHDSPGFRSLPTAEK
jgi:hypothetical protein